MSTLSGVFPNAITPTFAASNDPAQQTRLRRENETAVFSPVEEVETTADTRRPASEQPGRLEAERATETASRLSQNESGTTIQGREPERSDAEAVDPQQRRDEVSREQRERVSAQKEAKLEEEVDLIRELAARDREVRSHEQAHQSVGGQYAGSMEFSFRQGPDGKRYAVGGEVSISVGKVSGDPQATLQKAEQIRRAALAPAEPSSQDRQVAAMASQMSIEAQNDIRQVERQDMEKASEERAEQAELSEEDGTKTEASSQRDTEKSEQAATEKEDRLQDILARTSDTVESALDAAYRTAQQQDIGFNLDTTV